MPYSFSFVSPQEGTGVVMPMFSKEDVGAAMLLNLGRERRRKYIFIPKRPTNPHSVQPNPICPPSEYEFKR